MAEQLVEWSDFSKGEAGRYGLTKPPAPGFWSGRNMMVYANGFLGPRPGLKDIGATAVPTGRIVGVEGFRQFSPTREDIKVIRHVDDGTPAISLYNLRLDGSPAAAAPSADVAADPTAYLLATAQAGQYLYHAEGSNAVHRAVIPSTAAGAAILSGLSSDPTGVVAHGVRVYAVTGNTVRYSAANNPTSWPSTNFFQVGSAEEFVTGLLTTGELLMIIKEDSLWALTGVTSSGRLVELGRGWGTTHQWMATLDRGRKVWFVHRDLPNPVVFDGAETAVIEHIEVVRQLLSPGPQAAPREFGVRTGSARDASGTVFFLEDRRATGADAALLTAFNGKTWTQHEVPLDISASMVPWPGQPRMLIPEETDVAAAAVRWLEWDYLLDRPGFTTDDHARPGDDSDTPLDAYASLPEHWLPSGEEATVRQVVVDMVKWDTGSATPNQLDVTVETFGRRGLDSESTTTKSWTEAGTEASADGTRQRLVLDFGTTTPGAGVQIKLTNVKGAAVRAVRAVLDTRPGRPRR